MYLRFVTNKINRESHCAQGFFQAAYRLKKSGRLSGRQQTTMEDCLDWFNRCLKVPAKFSAYRDYKRRPRRAICWFKEEAREALHHAWRMAQVMDCNGIPLWLLHSRCPGYVAYEDANQIAAEPFRETVLTKEPLDDAIGGDVWMKYYVLFDHRRECLAWEPIPPVKRAL